MRQLWKTTALRAGLSRGRCLSKGDSNRFIDAPRYARLCESDDALVGQ